MCICVSDCKWGICSNSNCCVAVNMLQDLPKKMKIGSQMMIDDDREQTGTQRICIHRVFIICTLCAFSGSYYVSSLLNVK
jgi:hypothetical protein